ncbi:MAG: phage tail protein, partial [Arcobacteraceae bacterium]
MDYFTLLTQTGATKITAAAANNTTVNLTHIAVGDGAGSVVMPDASQTALVGETYKTQLSDLKVDDNNSNWLVAVGYIPSDIGNFWVREVGIFDEDGDLIAVGNYPETFKPVMANNVAKDLYISVIIETSNAEAVTLTIDPSIVMASRLYVEENFSNKQHKHDEEYAALGGSELQRFKVADAEEDDEAVNVNQLNSKANISSPAFTGTPTAPTAAVGDSSTKIATTAFVATANNSKANISSPAFTGTPTAPTAAVGDSSTKI